MGRAVGVGLLLALGVGMPAEGQVRRAPGTVVGNQVVVQLYLILADSTNYVPLTRQRLDVRGQPEALGLTTNDAGGVTALLAPGPHYAVAADPVWWHGRQLTWKVPFDVHQGMGEVVLTLANAIVIDSVPHRGGAIGPSVVTSVVRSVAAGSVAGPAAEPSRVVVPGRARTGRVFVDIDGARWEVFEEQLGGLAPAPGERPTDSLYALVFHREGHTRQLDAYPPDWRRRTDAEVADLFDKARTVEP